MNPQQNYSPGEIGLGRLVSFDKGDFVGRLALEREAKAGGPARRLVGLQLDWYDIEGLYDAQGLPPAISPIVDRSPVPVFAAGRQVGRATSLGWSPILKQAIALASVGAAHEALGTRLGVEWTVEGRREPGRRDRRRAAVPRPGAQARLTDTSPQGDGGPWRPRATLAPPTSPDYASLHRTAPARHVRRGCSLTRRRAIAFALLWTLTAAWMSTAAIARPTAGPRTPSPAEFRPITIATTTAGPPVGAARPWAILDAIVIAPPTAPEQISDFAVEARTFAPRPVTRPRPTARRPSRSTVGWSFHGTGHRAGGSATWYCKTGSSVCASGYPGGMYAAAGPELRVGAWRGRIVRACGGGRCIVVKLIDWCACGGSHVIDLYSDAFRRLAPLNAGALKVTVSW